MYNAGWKAAKTVKDNGPQMMNNYIYIPGSQTVDKISPYITHPAAKEIVKHFVPGATPALNIAGALLKDKIASSYSIPKDKNMEQLKIIQAENDRLKAELESIKNGYLNTTSQKPEEVIRIFMMKGITIKDFTATQVVPIKGKITHDSECPRREVEGPEGLLLNGNILYQLV
ncbi:hypothetical protein AQUCO_06000084v1 [Aquilegia coerulea]|uniref:Uncharacterized protein n=2 Tax=Aquilegia coerulea TaxID=218851 RepID=A0A2G5CDV9_AQUCA|nr:hypothetical protein AQUCO_06000084v1 [Aquilegia coerulea]